MNLQHQLFKCNPFNPKPFPHHFKISSYRQPTNLFAALQHAKRPDSHAVSVSSYRFASRLRRRSRGARPPPRSAGQPPYRESLLTRVLADSFGSAEALVVAIGTVSPAAKDTEHSIGTTACDA